MKPLRTTPNTVEEHPLLVDVLLVDVSSTQHPNKVMVISKDDWNLLQQESHGEPWVVRRAGGHHGRSVRYAVGSWCPQYCAGYATIYAHHVITGQKHAKIYYRNSNTLDLRRENLSLNPPYKPRARACVDSSTGERCISEQLGKYRLIINYCGTCHHIGTFDDIPDAVDVRDDVEYALRQFSDPYEGMQLIADIKADFARPRGRKSYRKLEEQKKKEARERGEL